MPKLVIAFASATLLLASSGLWKANAATIANVGTLAPPTKSYAPAEQVAYYHRMAADMLAEPIAVVMATATGTRLMVTPTQPTRITATPTGRTVIGYGWRPGITIGIGRPWGWGWGY